MPKGAANSPSLLRTALRGGLPAHFRPVGLGEAPLRRVSRPPRIFPNSPVYVTEKLKKNPAGRRGSSPAGADTEGCQARDGTGTGAAPHAFGQAGRYVRTFRQLRAKEPGVEEAPPRPCPLIQTAPRPHLADKQTEGARDTAAGRERYVDWVSSSFEQPALPLAV